ncbi:DUF3540 domain-containing protein [Amorphus sp. MBR-141]
MQTSSPGTTLVAEVSEATAEIQAARGEAVMAHGEVGEVHTARFRLETDRGPILARRAVSCLVEPQAGDRVLYLVEEDGRGTILHILSRAEGATRDVLVSNPDGALRLRGQSVAVETPGPYAVSAGSVAIQSATADIMAGTLTMTGETLRQVYGRTQTNTRSQETMAERIVTKALERIEIIDNTDNQFVGTMSLKVTGVLTQSSYTTVLVAEEDLRMDGKRVTVG